MNRGLWTASTRLAVKLRTRPGMTKSDNNFIEASLGRCMRGYRTRWLGTSKVPFDPLATVLRLPLLGFVLRS